MSAKQLKTLKHCQKFKCKRKNLKTYNDGCPNQGLSNHTTFRRFWAGETVPLNIITDDLQFRTKFISQLLLQGKASIQTLFLLYFNKKCNLHLQLQEQQIDKTPPSYTHIPATSQFIKTRLRLTVIALCLFSQLSLVDFVLPLCHFAGS